MPSKLAGFVFSRVAISYFCFTSSFSALLLNLDSLLNSLLPPTGLCLHRSERVVVLLIKHVLSCFCYSGVCMQFVVSICLFSLNKGLLCLRN